MTRKKLTGKFKTKLIPVRFNLEEFAEIKRQMKRAKCPYWNTFIRQIVLRHMDKSKKKELKLVKMEEVEVKDDND